MTRPRSWLLALVAFGVPVAFLFSLVFVVMEALSQPVLVGRRRDLASVGFGRPLVWVHQDLTSTDPPLPGTVGLDSPWEHPVQVHGVAFLLDLMIVFAVVAVVVLVVAAALVAFRRRVVPLRG